MTEFPNLAAHARAHSWDKARHRATSTEALNAWARYAELPVNPASAGLFDQIEQDAFTTGFDLGRDTTESITAQLRISNLQAERERLERRMEAAGIDPNGETQSAIQLDALTAEIREGLGL